MNSAKAELVKPNNSLEPHQVVKIQLKGLKYNDEPKKNNGIEQTWEFAHPSNKKYTGPLPRFINLLKSESYKMLINHLDSEIIEVFKSSNQYGFEITILGNDKKYYKLQQEIKSADDCLRNKYRAKILSLKKELNRYKQRKDNEK